MMVLCAYPKFGCGLMQCRYPQSSILHLVPRAKGKGQRADAQLASPQMELEDG